VYPIRNEINTKRQFNPTIFAEDGTPLAYQSFNDSSRQDDIPLLIIDSNTTTLFNYLILREDPSFYSSFYFGVSARNLFPSNGAGGSTIPQQYLKGLAHPKFVTDNSQRTIISKLGEISAAFKFCNYYKSPQMLQLYANEVAWLNGAYGGVQLNTLRYFQVNNLRDLNLYEQYLMCRSVRGVNACGIDYRRLSSLDKDSLDTLFSHSYRSMLINNNRASEEDLEQMLSMPVRFRKKPLNLHNRPYIFDLIKPLPDSFKIPGAQYITTLQTPAIDAVDQAFEMYARQNKDLLYKTNALLDANAVLLDLQTGNIVGINSKPLCNPKDSTKRMQNHTFSTRPAASTVKIFLIAEALKHGLLKETDTLVDEYRGRLHNHHNTYYGKVSLATLIQKSLNTPLDNCRVRNALVDNLENDLAAIFGDTLTPLPANYSKSQYCIGEPRLLTIPQMAMLFRALLTDGVVHKTRITKTILGTDTYPFDTLFQWQPQSFKIFPESTCGSIRELLKAPLTPGGTLHQLVPILNNPEDVVGKSGTSDSYSTGWTVLANSRYLVVVSINYFNLNNSQIARKHAIPTKSGGGSAGILAAYILNNLKN
jgi:membrane peptidoglycan carboxypeptidase